MFGVMTKKIVYLFLALLLPGLIFLFLKKFGKNEFALPTYYQHGVDSLNMLCGTVYSQPYQLPDSVLKKTGWKRRSASVFVFQNEAAINHIKKSSAKELESTRDQGSQKVQNTIDENEKTLSTYRKYADNGVRTLDEKVRQKQESMLDASR